MHNYTLWLDFIERDFIETTMPKALKEGLYVGATSNPAIFAKAIGSSLAYKAQLSSLEGLEAKQKYEALAIEDIKAAAKVLNEYSQCSALAKISIEIDPFYSDDFEQSYQEAKRLYEAIGYDNVMIKVPATTVGYELIYRLMSEGIDVNATLIFSLEQAQEVYHAMKKAIDEGSKAQGVVSIFVSRFDRKIDPLLEGSAIPKGKTGILNAAKIAHFIGGHPQILPLFASTGVKSEQGLEADYYIAALEGFEAINTAPIEAIEAYKKTETTKAPTIKEANAHFAQLEAAGISIEKVAKELMKEGLEQFEEAFKTMLEGLN